jgi:hypothetical protein
MSDLARRITEGGVGAETADGAQIHPRRHLAVRASWLLDAYRRLEVYDTTEHTKMAIGALTVWLLLVGLSGDWHRGYQVRRTPAAAARRLGLPHDTFARYERVLVGAGLLVPIAVSAEMDTPGGWRVPDWEAAFVVQARRRDRAGSQVLRRGDSVLQVHIGALWALTAAAATTCGFYHRFRLAGAVVLMLARCEHSGTAAETYEVDVDRRTARRWIKRAARIGVHLVGLVAARRALSRQWWAAWRAEHAAIRQEGAEWAAELRSLPPP